MEKGAEAFAEWERGATELLDVSAVGLLEENQESVKRSAVEILIKLLSNVEKDPVNVKFRSFCVENQRIKTQLLPARGAWETLIGVGFIQDGDRLVLPLGTSSLKISKPKLVTEVNFQTYFVANILIPKFNNLSICWALLQGVTTQCA